MIAYYALLGKMYTTKEIFKICYVLMLCTLYLYEYFLSLNCIHFKWPNNLVLLKLVNKCVKISKYNNYNNKL